MAGRGGSGAVLGGQGGQGTAGSRTSGAKGAGGRTRAPRGPRRAAARLRGHPEPVPPGSPGAAALPVRAVSCPVAAPAVATASATPGRDLSLVTEAEWVDEGETTDGVVR